MSNLACVDCGESFDYPSQLERHKKSKKKCGINKTVTEITCNYCEKKYATKHSLIRHQTICKKKNNIVVEDNIREITTFVKHTTTSGNVRYA